MRYASAVKRTSSVSAQLSATRPIYGAAYNLAKKVLPKISETERAALECGTVGWDRELFSGSPRLKNIMNYNAHLTEKEMSFLNNEVNELCEMLDDYQIQIDQDMPDEVWAFIKSKKFLGMVIPEKYGGLGFSAYGHSAAITKIATRSAGTSVSIIVPNSLGPGELLHKYGTEEQKDYYLPRLAIGQEVPCFGLTGPTAGSDAASIPDNGTVVVKNGVLGIVMNFNKRYITLAPLATVVGLAFNLKDPDNLLQGSGKPGITLALLPRGHDGMRIGDRHDVLSVAFMNGTVAGENVFIPMSMVIGGQGMIGSGWNMLMECLSEGRGVSLPAMSVAASQLSTAAVGAYARIRKQFKIPIAEMEGVQEKLANIASNTLILTASQRFMNSILNNHEKPSVLSAVMKYEMTERYRSVVNDAMDIVGGAGICKGKDNFLASPYQAIPIAITVEGSNTLTRSLIIFGQGLVRSHPHLLDLMNSIRDGNNQKAFKTHLNAIVSHAVSNSVGALVASVTRQRFMIGPGGPVAYYESQLNRLAQSFAAVSDMTLVMGGNLKMAEMVSGRMADVLSNLYLGYATLWYYKTHHVESMDQILHMSMQSILHKTQESLIQTADNFPLRPVGWAMKAVSFPFGRSYTPPTDKQLVAASNAITTDTRIRAQLIESVFVSKNPNDRVTMLTSAFSKCLQADATLSAIKKKKRQPTDAEAALIKETDDLRSIIIQVNSFKTIASSKRNLF